MIRSIKQLDQSLSESKTKMKSDVEVSHCLNHFLIICQFFSIK
jgi:hypothetical protein